MNTATAETESPAEVEFYKAEIRRMNAEIEQILADTEGSQRRINALAASTQARLDHIKAMIRGCDPSANPFS